MQNFYGIIHLAKIGVFFFTFPFAYINVFTKAEENEKPCSHTRFICIIYTTWRAYHCLSLLQQEIGLRLMKDAAHFMVLFIEPYTGYYLQSLSVSALNQIHI